MRRDEGIFRQKYRHVQRFYISASLTAFDLDLHSPGGRNIRYVFSVANNPVNTLLLNLQSIDSFLIRQKDIWNTRDAVDGTARLPRPSFMAARRRIVESVVRLARRSSARRSRSRR